MTLTRRRRGWPLLVVLLLTAAFVLLWWFPANWAWGLVHDRYPSVQVESLHGSVWNGHADGLRLAGRPLGTLDWTLDRAALLGFLHGNFDLRGPSVTASGHIARSDDGAIVGTDLHFSVPAAQVPAALFDGMRAGGTVQGDMAQVRLLHGWPTQLKGVMTWKSASLSAHGRRAQLGDLQAQWHEVDGTVVQADLHELGDGPLRLQGRFTVSPLGWRLDATLTPRAYDANLHDVLQRLGSTDADGSVQLRRRGGLMLGD